MKKASFILFSTSFLAAFLLLGTSMMNADAQAPFPTSANVVLLVCTIDTQVPPTGYNVLVSTASAGTPVVSAGTGCAQALADTLSAGFELVDVKGDQAATTTNYLLRR